MGADKMAKGADSRQGARKRVGDARGRGFSRPVCQFARRNRTQPIAVRRPWQRVNFARYTMAPGSA
jgi:hypothetical protein